MTQKANEALEAERLAAEAEAIFTPTPEQVKLLKRYKELKARQDEIVTELSAIQFAINADMDEKGAKALRVNGKNWVIVSDVNAKVVDMDSVKAKYPGVVAAYVTVVQEFTSQVTQTRARRTFKPA